MKKGILIRILRRGIVTLDYSYVLKRCPEEVKELLDKIKFKIEVERSIYVDATIEFIGISPMFREIRADKIPPHYDLNKLLIEKDLRRNLLYGE